MKVVCIDDHAYLFESREKMLAAQERRAAGQQQPGDRLSDITVGKDYEVIRERLGMYAIVDNTGESYLYPKSRFRPVDEADDPPT